MLIFTFRLRLTTLRWYLLYDLLFLSFERLHLSLKIYHIGWFVDGLRLLIHMQFANIRHSELLEVTIAEILIIHRERRLDVHLGHLFLLLYDRTLAIQLVTALL